MSCQLSISRRAFGSASPRLATAAPQPSVIRRHLVCNSSKGFGSDNKDSQEQGSGASGAQAEASSVDELESRIRGGRTRKGRIEPKVKVDAPVVDAVSGKSPVTAASQAETAAVLGLFYFFLFILIEGLLLAGSGFLSEDLDQWVQEKLYPSFSPTVLLFLGCSSIYGLFKTGKLPGQKQL